MSGQIQAFMPLEFRGNGPSEICYRICSHWPAQGQPVTVHAPAAVRPDPAGILSLVVPRAAPARLSGRVAGSRRLGGALRRISVNRGLRAARPGDICYFWPGVGLDAMKAARDRGAMVVVEFINTHCGYAKRILDAECARIGAPRYAFSEAMLLEEAERVAVADAIFAPGPFVGPSLVENGGGGKVLEVSYGAYPAVDPPRRRPGAARPLRFLFVGWACVRKGVHVLMEAWRSCALDAELVIVGQPEDYIMRNHLADPPAGVRYVMWSDDIWSFYRECDIFVFPSLEEGGPQVVYEAAAYGLPLIVTPMGGGWIAQDRRNALVVPPADSDALARAMRELHADAALRLALGACAAADAAAFDWPLIARRRLEALRNLQR